LVLLDCREIGNTLSVGAICIAATLRWQLKSAESDLTIDLYEHLATLPDKPVCTVRLSPRYQGNNHGFLSDITLPLESLC
jgi:hypothetical protein